MTRKMVNADLINSLFGRADKQAAEEKPAGTEAGERMKREGEDGGRRAAPKREEADGRGRGVRRSGERRDADVTAGPEDPGGSKRVQKRPQKAVERVGEPKSIQTYVRLPVSMQAAVEKAVKDSPIEFGSVSEFIRRAVEIELRRRGLVQNYK